MSDFLLSYDTVTLSPNYSTLNSRSEAITTTSLRGWNFKVPVVPANMLDVINYPLAKQLSEKTYFYIYHRFGNDIYDFVKKANEENLRLISISVGINEPFYQELTRIKQAGLRVDFITIDIAHAHHSKVEPMMKFVKELFPLIYLIVGNVATAEAALYLAKLHADVIKVGIGGGSICTTRYATGFHIPTLQSVNDSVEILSKTGYGGIPIIADGGAKHYGDVAKALVFGAKMVMSGGWFASCIDSPANIIEGRKVYRGSTSYEIKGHTRHVEGKQLELVEGTTFDQRLTEIRDAIQSSISYAGGRDLTAFKTVTWGRILPFH
jgi:GMP reductase